MQHFVWDNLAKIQHFMRWKTRNATFIEVNYPQRNIYETLPIMHHVTGWITAPCMSYSSHLKCTTSFTMQPLPQITDPCYTFCPSLFPSSPISPFLGLPQVVFSQLAEQQAQHWGQQERTLPRNPSSWSCHRSWTLSTGDDRWR